ncbi:MAG: phosphoribosylformylglycinamidine synthase subunit PurL [Candidatus Levybacteria bacterium]|nr:phosphoribosylformylglycinamidine synthase subunit PurL [Candidatus Levybacteria bacterium]
MIYEIRVGEKYKDLKGDALLHETNSSGLNGIKKILTSRVYRLEGITKNEAQILKDNLLCENITQVSSLNRPLITNASHVIEIGYMPGVMNPEVASIIKAAYDLGINLIAADSSIAYGLFGKVDKKIINEITQKLYNKTVERIITQKPKTFVIKGKTGKTSVINLREMNDDELNELSKDKLFLNLLEMKTIQEYFKKIKRDPTDCEIETIAQTWSEHSGHKTFKAKLLVDGKDKKPLIERLKQEALKHKNNIVSAFIDNSGVMDFYDGWAISGKGETHNSPSAIEPYGGAMTGSGGVFRDIVGTGQGGKTIISTDIFCLAKPNLPFLKLPPGCLHPRYVLKQVIKGVKDYGNRMGIPTNNGSIHFHDDFRAKPTVLVGAYGITPKKYAQKGKPKKEDIIVSIGGRIGRDGIHGATFSSGEMTERTITVNSQAVQIGNAIEEKRTFDAILEARDKNLIRAIQDCGGGGLSSAIGEMGQDTGVRVHLKNALLKYQGLSPWEIWLSESQERMVLAIPKSKLSKFKKVCKKYNVEISVLGNFDGSKKLQVYYGKEKVCVLDMKFLHHGLPQREMTATRPSITLSEAKDLDSSASLRMTLPKTQKEWIQILNKVLSHGNICSKEPIVRLYDHTVQGTSDLQPFSGELGDGPNDAAVIRPLLDKPYGMVVAHGINPILNRIDPYWGSIWAATEAISNYAAVGGDYKNASLINNYVWPFPDEESLWSLDKSVDAVCDFMKALKIPVISGKDSLSSTYRGHDGTFIKIPEVLCISVFGKIPDVTKTVSSDFKKSGSTILIVGKPDLENMGGSVYLDAVLNNRSMKQWSNIPNVDLKLLPKTLNTIYKGIQAGKILSCHDISEGGMITTIFEMCVGGDCGANISLDVILSKAKNLRSDYFLFNETAGCFIVEVENEKVAKKIFKNIPYFIVGKTEKEKNITVKQKDKTLFKERVEELRKVWQEPMTQIFS